MKILWITRKKGIPALLLFVVLFFLPLSSCCAAVPSPVAAPAPSSASAAPSAPPPHPAGPWGEPLINPAREWTIIAYLDGDNNLEESALNDLKEMEEGWPGGRAEVVVLVDRSKEYTTRMDDWTGTRGYRLNKSLRKDAIDSELLQDYGEMNLGDPAVLERYIHEALRKFPSPKAALFMWDHGAGWINMVNDDDAPGTERNSDEITLAEFKGVLEKTAPLLPRKKWDLLFFDMCLMGQAETVTACAPFADYMVAAAPTIPDVGMDYRNALPLFAGGTETAKIAAEFVKVGGTGLFRSSEIQRRLHGLRSFKDRRVPERLHRLFPQACRSRPGPVGKHHPVHFLLHELRRQGRLPPRRGLHLEHRPPGLARSSRQNHGQFSRKGDRRPRERHLPADHRHG